jgi:undecaprenyl-diphosphatase
VTVPRGTPLRRSAGDHIHGQIAVGFVTAGVCAYATVRFLSRWFTTRTLTPLAIYSFVAGVASIIWFA